VRISTSDVRRIIRFVDIAPPGNTAEPFAPSTLGALTDVIGADQVDYFEVLRRDRRYPVFTRAYAEDDPPWLDEVIPRIRHQNPIGAFRWSPANGPLRMSAVIDPWELRQLDYYHDFLVPAGIRDRLRVWLWGMPEGAACLTLLRTDRDFTDQDVALLAVLQPHLTWLRRAGHAGQGVSRSTETELTVREAQVLTLAAVGQANKEIGQLLAMSPATVRKHLEHAYRKLNADGRSEIAAWLRSGRAT
jgi:DNA-binding CsgD family transcriptional regulator